jgi:hypothetical protein
MMSVAKPASFISPVTQDAQEAEIIELTWEQLEGIQGGYSWRRSFLDITSFFRQVGEVVGNVAINVSDKRSSAPSRSLQFLLGM